MDYLMKQVQMELAEMAHCGMRVPEAAFIAAEDATIIKEFADMSVSDIAEMLIDVASIRAQ